MIRDFLLNEDGISSVEYALLLALIGAGILGAAMTLGDSVALKMETTADCVDNVDNC